MHRVNGVEIEIEFEHIHAGFSQESELALLRVLLHDRAHILLAHAAFMRHARNLKLRGGGRNVGIKSRTRCGNKVRRNRRIRIRWLQRLSRWH